MTHFAGAVLCIGGMALLVATDERFGMGNVNPPLGDFLVVAGASVFAVSIIAQVGVWRGNTKQSSRTLWEHRAA